MCAMDWAPTAGALTPWAAITCFLAGIVALALVELLIAAVLLKRVLNAGSRLAVSSVSDLHIASEPNSMRVQGKAWVAPLPDCIDFTKVIMKQMRKEKEKDGQRDGSRRSEDAKDVLEIVPVRVQAMLKGRILFLTAADGAQEEVSLEGCQVLTVSSSPGPNRKWGKKFPIKLHHSSRHLYRGFNTLLFFSESGYAKETWCEGFRVMADPRLSDWTCKTKREYRKYTYAAEENMPYLTKFYAAEEAGDIGVKLKEELGVQSRARKMTNRLRRLTRKVSIGMDKESKLAQTVEEACRRMGVVKSKDTDGVTFADQVDLSANSEGSANGEGSEGASVAPGNSQKDDGEAQLSRAHKGRAGKEIEQGVLCLNMVIARLYFDFNRNARRLASVERFFQRLMMKIRAPSYIKSITIRELDLGRHPPFATAVRMVPGDAEGALALEADVQWRGGGHLTCETRLDLREQSAQEKAVNQLTESGSEQDAAAALLSDLDVSSSGNFAAAVQEGRQSGDEGSSKKGRIMSMMSRVADRLSQVPIVLKIRLVSLKGTAVFKLKAPPSDRVWFAFKTMPEIHIEPEPCIGERRISALGDFIAKQIKRQIRESVVLPYCEDLFLDWMMADKENWLPTSSFPLPFFDSQLSEDQRKPFKRTAEVQSSSSDESGRHGRQPQITHNGRNKPPKGDASQGPPKAQEQVGASHASSTQPSVSFQSPSHSFLHPRRSNSDHVLSKFLSSKPPRPLGAAAHLSSPLSDPVQAIASASLSLPSPMTSKESMPFFQYDTEQNPGSAGDSETLSMASDSRSKDHSLHSEGLASESDLYSPGTQGAYVEGVKESVHSVPHSRRAKVKNIKSNMFGKLHHKRADNADDSAPRRPKVEVGP